MYTDSPEREESGVSERTLCLFEVLSGGFYWILKVKETNDFA